jgi:hypothetical protein
MPLRGLLGAVPPAAQLAASFTLARCFWALAAQLQIFLYRRIAGNDTYPTLMHAHITRHRLEHHLGVGHSGGSLAAPCKSKKHHGYEN